MATSAPINPNQIIPPSNVLTLEELSKLDTIIKAYHNFTPSPKNYASIIKQRIDTPLSFIRPFVRDCANPNRYKHFIKSCAMKAGHGEVGSVRDVSIISGLPASASTESLEILDDEKFVLSFKVMGGDHRLQNYRSVTSVNEFMNKESGEIYCIVLESYIEDIPEGNSEEDTRMLAALS